MIVGADRISQDGTEVTFTQLATAAGLVAGVTSATTGITAHAGGGQGSAVALTTQYNNVTVCATAADSVKLPTAALGLTVTVRNAGVAALAVFPNTSGTINGGSANASITIAPGAELTFRGISVTGWMTNAVATTTELSKLSGAPFTVTQTSTPATGTNGTQFILKDAAGTAVSVPVAGTFYLSSDNAGATPVQPATGIAALTNGAIASRGATALKGPFYDYTTTAAGLLGITLTATSGSYYINFVLPNGKIITSTVLTVN